MLTLVVLIGGGVLGWHHLTRVPVVARADVSPDAPLTLTAQRFGAITGDTTVIAPPRDDLGNQNHAYLHHDGTTFWAMWSSGPPVEDEPGQEVRYATSPDGMNWSAPRLLSAPRSEDHGLIARGFWAHPDGRLVAIIAEFRGTGGAFGAAKHTRTLLMEKGEPGWQRAETLLQDTITNYPPFAQDGVYYLPSRDTTHRSRFESSLLASDATGRGWMSAHEFAWDSEGGFRPDEPAMFTAGDGRLCVLFRNNGLDRRLYHSCRLRAQGWTKPAAVALPNNCSKTFPLRLDPDSLLLSGNFEPARERSILHLALAEVDGSIDRVLRVTTLSEWTLSSMHRLLYPHMIRQGTDLYLIYSIDKRKIEVMRLALSDVRAGRGSLMAHATALFAALKRDLNTLLRPGVQYC